MKTRIVISTYRILKGMSPGQLAAKMHVTVDEVIRWESGETVPDLETLQRLSKVLRVSVSTLHLSFLNDLALVQKRSRICSLKTA